MESDHNGYDQTVITVMTVTLVNLTTGREREVITVMTMWSKQS